MAIAELDQQRIDRADLHTLSPAGIAHVCRFHGIVPVGLHTRQHREVMQQQVAVFRTRKALQQLLQNQAGCQHLVRAQRRCWSPTKVSTNFKQCSGDGGIGSSAGSLPPSAARRQVLSRCTRARRASLSRALRS